MEAQNEKLKNAISGYRESSTQLDTLATQVITVFITGIFFVLPSSSNLTNILVQAGIVLGIITLAVHFLSLVTAKKSRENQIKMHEYKDIKSPNEMIDKGDSTGETSDSPYNIKLTRRVQLFNFYAEATDRLNKLAYALLSVLFILSVIAVVLLK